MKNHNETTLRELLGLFCADIDIFLLQDEAQENDLDKMYSKEEIREQLHKSMRKFTSLPNIYPPLFDAPLFSILMDASLLDNGFSKREIEEAKKNAEELSKND